MALASELVELLSDVTGIPKATMTRYARFAREAGLLSQSGRGKSAAHMRPDDAVNLLICLLVNGVAQDASTYITTARQMDVYSSDSDKLLDDRYFESNTRSQLRQTLPILFNREHTFPELLRALVEAAIDDWQGFEERLGDSYIVFDCDIYEALVDFTIYPDDTLVSDPRISITFSYNHPLIGRRYPGFQRTTQLRFSVIARIGQLMAHKPKESSNA